MSKDAVGDAVDCTILCAVDSAVDSELCRVLGRMPGSTLDSRCALIIVVDRAFAVVCLRWTA